MSQSKLRFSIEESVWLKKGQEVAEVLSMSLNPEISISEEAGQVYIKGALVLNGKYCAEKQDDNERSKFDENPLSEGVSYRSLTQLNTAEDGVTELVHRFPVDITIPSYRVEDSNQVKVEVESFEYELPNSTCFELSASICIYGIKDEKQQRQESHSYEEPIETVRSAATEEPFDQKEEKSEIFTPFQFEARQSGGVPSQPLQNEFQNSFREEAAEVRPEKKTSYEFKPYFEASDDRTMEATFDSLKSIAFSNDDMRNPSIEQKDEAAQTEEQYLAEAEEPQEQSDYDEEPAQEQEYVEYESYEQPYAQQDYQTQDSNNDQQNTYQDQPSYQQQDRPYLDQSYQQQDRPYLDQSYQQQDRPYPDQSYQQQDRPYPDQSYQQQDIPYPDQSYQQQDRPYPDQSYQQQDRPYPDQSYQQQDRPYPDQSYQQQDRPYPDQSYQQQDRPYPDHSYQQQDRPYPDHSYQQQAYPPQGNSYPEYQSQYGDRPYEAEEYGEQTYQDEQEYDDQNYQYAEEHESYSKEAESEAESYEVQESPQGGREEEPRDENALYLTKMLSGKEERFSKMRMYILQRGDSLEHICERYDISLNTLMRMNQLQQGEVSEGQIIYIPVSSR
jgi:stage VI sporulation protein D